MHKTAKEMIDEFKTEIDLVAFLQKDGYKIDPSEGIGKFVKMKHEDKDTLLIYKTENNQYRYSNRHDSSDKGNIIDYVAKTRNLNLVAGGSDWKALFDELNGVIGNLNVRNSNVAPVLVKNTSRTEPSPVNTDLRLLAYTDHSYLNKRGLDSPLLQSEEFKGKIFNRKYFDKDSQSYGMNTVFPIENINGFIGINIRNDNFNKVEGVRYDGLWISNIIGNNKPKEIFITESAIDALSYHKLNPVEKSGDRLYIATLGQHSQEQVNSIQFLINKIQPDKILLGNDLDPAGKRFNIDFLGKLQLPGQTTEMSCTISLNNKKAEATLTIEIGKNSSLHQNEVDELINKKINAGVPTDLELKRAESFAFHKDEEKTLIQVKIPNTLPFLARTEDFIRSARNIENRIKVVMPLGKDFNVDLENSLKSNVSMERKPYNKVGSL